jgi:hypothetical protein
VRYLLPPPIPTDLNVAIAGSPPYQGFLGPSRQNRFIVANDVDPLGAQRRVVLSNLNNAQAVYVVDVVDCDVMDESFQQALVSSLAAKFVIPLTGNKDMRAGFIQSASDAVIMARANDGNEAIPSTDHTPDWMRARGYPGYAAYGTGGFDIFEGLGLWNDGWTNMGWGM